MNSDLLLELGCEDLPARYVLPLANALKDGVTGGLSRRGIAAGAAQAFATPRRIAVTVEAVVARQDDQKIERLGPALAAAMKDGQPTPAALGFAKSCGVEFAALEQKDGKLYFAKSQPGRATADLLPEIFEEVLKGMDALVPKRMRWGSGEETFVRPVQWIVCLLGGTAPARSRAAIVIPLKRFGLKAGNKTCGHRFHAPKAIVLKSPAEYEKKLKAAKVWADFESRKTEIRQQIEAEARKLKGTARITEDLLDEVTALVEWPVAIHGRMEERFMQLPPEVIIATIEHNQRYFPVFGADGKLLPSFITVSNIQSRDFKQVIAGNERVVRPRLSDALFFWEQDRKKKLADYLPGLDKLTFQKELGSVGDKSRRVAKLAVHIAGLLHENAGTVERAAALCKADLVTRMVFEIPELQGIMGGYYAEASGEPKAVAGAIREHYQPVQSGGAIPATRAGQIVALADKLDSLAGIFAIGQKPTASKDPFALRRAAIGIWRILKEGKLPLGTGSLLRTALQLQPAGKHDDKTFHDLNEFVGERFRYLLLEEGVRPEEYDAISRLEPSPPHVLDFMARLKAVRAFVSLPESTQLAAAHKRIRNILKQAGDDKAPVAEALLREKPEKDLNAALKQFSVEVEQGVLNGEYGSSLKTLARLQAPVDAFFDKVMVMAPESELRANRIALLRQLDKLCRSVADISCLPG